MPPTSVAVPYQVVIGVTVADHNVQWSSASCPALLASATALLAFASVPPQPRRLSVPSPLSGWRGPAGLLAASSAGQRLVRDASGTPWQGVQRGACVSTPARGGHGGR